MTQPSPRDYCIAKLGEEGGEVASAAARYFVFGNGLEDLEREAADVMAVIEFAIRHGVLNEGRLASLSQAKLRKLLDPNARDNMGRRLAPAPPGFK